MVSDRIKKLRISRGLTQEQLGEHLGVGKATVQKYESGQIQNLKTAHIKKLCELFNKRPHYFIFDNLEKYENNDEKIFEKIESVYGLPIATAFKKAINLNAAGRSRLLEYINDLCLIEKYKKR